MAYADLGDIEIRLQRELSASEEATAEALIDAASAALKKLVAIEPGSEEQAELLKFVCTNMVCRVMAPGMDIFGASQASMTAGAYTQSVTFNTPLGDMYMTKLEKKLLGISAGYIGSIEPEIRGYYGCSHD